VKLPNTLQYIFYKSFFEKGKSAKEVQTVLQEIKRQK